MVRPPSAFKLVFRSFDQFEYDRRKSDEVFDGRGFDFGYASRIFPGYVLERQDTRISHEVRFQAMGEILGEVFVLVYTKREQSCRIITARRAERYEEDMWYETTR